MDTWTWTQADHVVEVLHQQWRTKDVHVHVSLSMSVSMDTDMDRDNGHRQGHMDVDVGTGRFLQLNIRGFIRHIV